MYNKEEQGGFFNYVYTQDGHLMYGVGGCIYYTYSSYNLFCYVYAGCIYLLTVGSEMDSHTNTKLFRYTQGRHT